MEQTLFKNNKKRGFSLGVFIFLFATIIFASSADYAVSGCAGDCMTCHISLKGDKDHKALETCIKCHTASKDQNLNLFAKDNTGCGNRCFTCHNEWPKNGYHAPLDTCLTCHEK